MSASMIYCQCNYCGTPPQASAVNNFVVPFVSTTTLAPLCTNSCINVSTTTTANVASETRITETEEEPPRQREQLKFGIEKILYGSASKAGLFGTHLNVAYPIPRSRQRQTHSTPWSRPVFSDHQRKALEDHFQLQHYLSKRERYHLSLYLGLTEHQIKVWFQNRRVKFRQAQKAKKQSTKLPRVIPSVENS